MPVKASGRTLRTDHSGLRAESVARVKCSTSQGRPTGSAENVGGPRQDNRSGENQAGAAVSRSSTSDGEWHRDVKVGRGGERSQVGESPPVLLGEASSRQPKGRGPAPPLGNERMFGLKITEGPSNGSSVNPRRGAERSGMLAYMRRTTVKLPDDLDAKLRHEAQAQGKTISELTREAIEAHLDHKTGSRRRLMAGGVGHSGHPDISERIEEILRAEVAR